MNKTSNTQNPLVLSYLGLRKSIGFIGMVLPIVLAFRASLHLLREFASGLLTLL